VLKKNFYDLNLSKTLTKNRLIGLLRMMKGYHWLYIGSTTALAIATISRTGVYLVLRRFVDDVIIAGNFGSNLTNIILMFIGLALIQGGFSFISGWLASKTAESATRRLRNYLFDHLQRLPYAYHAEAKTGDLIARSTSDVDAINRFYGEQAIGIGRILLMFIVNFIALLQLNTRLALYSVIAIPVIIAVSIFFFKRVSKAYEAYQEQEATLSNRLQENLTGVRVVKAFARQGYESYKFDQENWQKFRLGKKLLSLHYYLRCSNVNLFFSGRRHGTQRHNHHWYLYRFCISCHLDHLANAGIRTADRSDINRDGLLSPNF